MENKSLVFISHATPTDNTFAVWLATKLELCGYEVWVDLNNLPPSVDFWQTIDETIRQKACKFLFVVSKESVDPSRDGVQKELAIADRVRRENPTFITALRIDDVNFNNFPAEILRLNAIDFKTDWAAGLEKLLKTLKEEGVPQSRYREDSHFYLDRWNFSQAPVRSLVTDDMDQYSSNLFLLEKPPFVYFYYAEDVEDILKHNHAPMKKIKKIVATFACSKCVEEWSGLVPVFERYLTEDLLHIHDPISCLGEIIKTPSHDVISLINWSIGEMFYKKHLRRYNPSSERRSRNVYYFQTGSKSKRASQGRAKMLSGTYKKKKNWHFGLSGFFVQYPEEGIIVKWHLIFSDEAGKILPESLQIAARRSKGKRMFNKEWKELLHASMFYLADGSDNIYYSSCCDENALYVRRESERFVSPKSYPEPTQLREEVENE